MTIMMMIFVSSLHESCTASACLTCGILTPSDYPAWFEVSQLAVPKFSLIVPCWVDKQSTAGIRLILPGALCIILKTAVLLACGPPAGLNRRCAILKEWSII